MKAAWPWVPAWMALALVGAVVAVLWLTSGRLDDPARDALVWLLMLLGFGFVSGAVSALRR